MNARPGLPRPVTVKAGVSGKMANAPFLDRVVEQLLAMRQQRKKHLHAIIEKINNRIGNNTMRFFPDLTAFQQVYPDGNFIDWKIYQSVAAELYAHDLERLC